MSVSEELRNLNRLAESGRCFRSTCERKPTMMIMFIHDRDLVPVFAPCDEHLADLASIFLGVRPGFNLAAVLAAMGEQDLRRLIDPRIVGPSARGGKQ